jgi:hypothetical protein
MARALRLERAGGRYHVTARGNERKTIFRDDTDHFHFLEQAQREERDSFADRHGDWGRDAGLWLGRRAGRLPLIELGQWAGGLDYAVVSKAIARFGRL